MNVREVIGAFGGPKSMAIAVGRTPSGVGYWRAVGYIPLINHDKVLDAAERCGVELTREVLVSQVERADPLPQGGPPKAKAKSKEVVRMAKAGMRLIEISRELSISYSSVLRIMKNAGNM